MGAQISPTKGNLLNLKKSLELAKLGYDLLDRKRNILIREASDLADRAKEIGENITRAYNEAYEALRAANIELGKVDYISRASIEENIMDISYNSVMGVDIPKISYETDGKLVNYYGFYDTSSALDDAYLLFSKAKKFTIELAEVENSIYRLSTGISKTQKRANALKNIIIPRYESQVKFVSAALEEKEREEFSRLKVIKARNY